jgi:hypothetical protein
VLTEGLFLGLSSTLTAVSTLPSLIPALSPRKPSPDAVALVVVQRELEALKADRAAEADLLRPSAVVGFTLFRKP